MAGAKVAGKFVGEIRQLVGSFAVCACAAAAGRGVCRQVCLQVLVYFDMRFGFSGAAALCRERRACPTCWFDGMRSISFFPRVSGPHGHGVVGECAGETYQLPGSVAVWAFAVAAGRSLCRQICLQVLMCSYSLICVRKRLSVHCCAGAPRPLDASGGGEICGLGRRRHGSVADLVFHD